MPRLVLKKAQVPAAPVTSAFNLAGPQAAYGLLRRLATRPVGHRRGQALGEMPKPATAEGRIAAQDAPKVAQDMTRNLFTDPQERRAWDAALGEIVDAAAQEVDLRAQLFRAVRAANVAPVVGKTLLRRALSYWRHLRAP